jgi:hypothetical protein
VVAGEHQSGALFVEAQVAGRVPRGVQRHQPPTGHLRPVAVLQQHVRPGHHHEAADQHAHPAQLLDLLLGRAGGPQPGVDPRQQLVGVLVPVRDQRRIGGVERDPRARRLPHPPCKPVVVGVDVRDQHPADVGEPGAEDPEPGLQRP